MMLVMPTTQNKLNPKKKPVCSQPNLLPSPMFTPPFEVPKYQPKLFPNGPYPLFQDLKKMILRIGV